MAHLANPADDSELPVWDTTALTRLMGDNPAIRRLLLEKFLSNGQEQVSAILDFVAAGNLAKMCSQAHALKSSARTVGAMRLGELCLALEQAGKVGDMHSCKILAERLSDTFAAAAEKIKSD